MNNTRSFYDFISFLKHNIKVILVTSIVVFLALLTASIYSILTNQEEVINEEYVINEILPEIDETTTLDSLGNQEQTALTNYLNRHSYSFRIYIENEDSTPFRDNELLRQFLIEENMVNHVENETGSEFTPSPDLAVSVFDISGSYMLQIKVGTGNLEDNLRIANYYYDILENEDLSILQNKTLHFVDSEPVIFEEMHGIEEVFSTPEEQPNVIQRLLNNIETILIVSILGII